MADSDKILQVLETLKKDFEKETKKTHKKLNNIQKDIEMVLSYHDQNVIALRQRIERLEEHTGLTKN